MNAAADLFPNPSVYDTLLVLLQAATVDWSTRAIFLGAGIFHALALVWFLKGWLHWFVMDGTRAGLVHKVFGRLLGIFFLDLFYFASPIAIPVLIRLFTEISTQMTGIDAMSPSKVFVLTIEISERVGLHGMTMWGALLGPWPMFMRLVAILAIWASALAIMFRIFKLYVEFYIWVKAGMVLLAFAAHEATREIANAYLGSVLDYASRMLVTTLVFGVMYQAIETVMALFSDSSFESVMSLMVLAGMAVLFALVVFSLPKEIAQALNLRNKLRVEKLSRMFI